MLFFTYAGVLDTVGNCILAEVLVDILFEPKSTCRNHVCNLSLSTLARCETEIQRRSRDPSVPFSANSRAYLLAVYELRPESLTACRA